MIDIPTITANTRFTGTLFERDDEGYENARVGRVFHSRYPDRFPPAVLMAEIENDIVEGVRFARERGWKVGIRSGGHSFPVWGVRDDALLIDLGGYKEISLDENTGIVSVTPSVQGGSELGVYLEQFGRFFPGGPCPTVGIGGFLLQGGMGWNHRGWGWASEQVLAIDVVTADGDLVRADAEQNSDLFWAARGAGPGFCGVITRFHLQTRPLPKALTGTMQIYPVERYAEILEWLSEAQKDIAPSVHLVAVSMNPQFEIPGHAGGYVFAVWGLAFCDTREEAEQALAPLATAPYCEHALIMNNAQPTTMKSEYEFVDVTHPKGFRYRVESAWVEGPYDEIAAAAQTLVMDRPSNEPGHTFFQYTLPHEGPDQAMSLMTEMMVGVYIIYSDAADDEKYRQWSLGAMKHLEPYTKGQYWGDSDQQHRRVKCLTDDAWKRLQVIRADRDPEGVFVDYLAGAGGYQNINEWETPEGVNLANTMSQSV